MLDGVMDDTLHGDWVDDEAEVDVAADHVVGSGVGEAGRRGDVAVQLLRLAHNSVVAVRLSCLVVHGADNSIALIASSSLAPL